MSSAGAPIFKGIRCGTGKKAGKGARWHLPNAEAWRIYFLLKYVFHGE